MHFGKKKVILLFTARLNLAMMQWRLVVIKVCLNSVKGLVSCCLCYPKFTIFEQGYLSIPVSVKI